MLSLDRSFVPSGRSRRAAGFTLIELMVALVVGLIVTIAAVGFVVSVAKANSEDIRITRLTQELRSLSEIASREIRRARYVADPVANIGQGATGGTVNQNDDMLISGSTCNAVPPTPSTNCCITIKYDEAPDEGGATVTRSIHLSGGQVYLGSTCGNGTAISSPQVEISSLRFDNDDDPATTLASVSADPADNVNTFVHARIEGNLKNDAATTDDLAAVTRVFQQGIFIRSGEVQ